MQPHISPRAADAIIGQLTYRGHDTATRYAAIDGQECEFTVHFETHWRRDRDDYGVLSSYAACEVIGAWAADPETDAAIWAGNRVELDALIGADRVSAWEDEISENVTMEGEWA